MPDSEWRPPKGFLKGINIHYFLDTYEEWHAFVQGWCESICPWPPFRQILSEELANQIKDEHHYYMFGRAMGMLTWVGVALGIRAMVK